MKLLDLPDHPRSTVYTMVVLALRNNPTLAATIHPGGWRTYSGDGDDDAPPGEDSLPALEVMPSAVAASPETLVQQQSPFGITINIATEGLDVRDIFNLWGSIEEALMPGDASKLLSHSIRTALAGTGAQISDIRLTSPAITLGPGLDRQMMVASGTILINMLIRK